jgi:hypothetical protein
MSTKETLVLNVASDHPQLTENDIVGIMWIKHGIEVTEEYVTFVLQSFHDAMADWIARQEEQDNWEDCSEAY